MSTKKENTRVKVLFDEQFESVKTFILARVQHEDDADELAQEAFLQMLKADERNFIRDPSKYLMQIAHNLVFKFRQEKYKHQIDDPASSSSQAQLEKKHQIPERHQNEIASEYVVNIDESVAAQRASEKLKASLMRLPPNIAAALVMAKRDGYTYDEIAQTLGVSSSMVKKYLRNGMKALRAEIEVEND